MNFSPDGKRRPRLEALPQSEHDRAEIVIAALELLMARRNESVYRGRAWWKLNNACNYLGDSFWKETRQASGESQ